MTAPAKPEKHPLGLGILIAEVDAPSKYNGALPPRCRPESEVQLVHVINPVHGQVRGYLLWDKRLWLRTPSYEGAWTDVDRAIERVLGVPVVPYEVAVNGRVTFHEGA